MVGDPLIPVMTSNTTPSGTAACSSYFDNNAFAAAWHAFDGNQNNSWLTTRYPTYPQWLSYDFGAGKEVYVTKFSIAGRYPENDYVATWAKSIKLQYSDDLSNWSDAYINDNVPKSYPLKGYIQVPDKHRAWRVLIAATHGISADSTGTGLSAFQLYGW